MQTELDQGHDLRERVRWRLAQLVSSGFSSRVAAKIARDERYDLHALIELVERSCPPELAVRILAPLAEEELP